MSDLFRFTIRSDYRAEILKIVPDALPVELQVLDVLVATDRMVADDGGPHPALVNWLAAIFDRRDGRDGAAVAVPVVPAPKTGPAGAEVVP